MEIQACPANCTCMNSSWNNNYITDCSQLQLVEIPSGIPVATNLL